MFSSPETVHTSTPLLRLFITEPIKRVALKTLIDNPYGEFFLFFCLPYNYRLKFRKFVSCGSRLNAYFTFSITPYRYAVV